MKLKIIGLIISVVIIILAIGLYMYNKPHRDIRSANPDYRTTVEKLMQEFGANQQVAFDKYSGKVLLVRGRVESISTSENGPTGVLMTEGEYHANCEMDSLFKMEQTQLIAGDSVNIKGLFVGFDDLLGELQLKKCIVEK